MRALLLSIKPEYVEKILQGSKKFEYRKRLAKEDVSVIYIYSTAPSMKVVASVQVLSRLSASPTAIRQKTKKEEAISQAKYKENYRGCKTAYAYELGAVNIFEVAKQLPEYGITSAPQSFAYIEIE